MKKPDGDGPRDATVPLSGWATERDPVRGRSREPAEAPAEGAFPAGARVGPYRIIEMLGEGGMGRVYLAEQREPLERRVALKLIRAALPDGSVLRRFQDEGRALARMSHPSIAQVFEAGTSARGEPFIAMEHVAGRPITVFADQRRLGIRQRLELFAAVCDGIQHAHEKAVIHRDIKPSNILVADTPPGPAPMPKIIDFGIAKALDRQEGADRLTQRWIGTPAYLSPEAAEASADGIVVDTRSDIYSLGVLLFTLLTGRQPHGTGSSMSILRRIVEEEAPWPSRFFRQMSPEDRAEMAAKRRLDPAGLDRALRGDLDWIVLEAMAKKRGDRYPSAAELAADVRRHLDHRPVLVGPPSTLYRARKLVRRHLAGVVATALVFCALVAGFVARSIEAGRANREAARANRQAAAAEQVTDFLVGLFRDADPSSAGGSADITAGELLDRGAERVRAELVEHPLPRSRVLVTIGAAYHELGAFEKAETLLREALALRQEHLPATDPEVLDSLISLASLLREVGDLDLAEPLLLQALDGIGEVAAGGGAAAEAERSIMLARAVMEMASVDANRGRLEDAEARLTQAIALRERFLGPDHPGVAAALNNLANLYFDLERFEEAEATHLRAIAIKKKALGPDHFHLAQSYNNLANVYLEMGRNDEAERLHQDSLAIKRKVLPPDHPEIGVSLHNLGNLAFERQAWPEAERLQLEAMAVFEATLASDHPYLSYPSAALGMLYHRQQRLEEAAPRLRRALALRASLGLASAEWRQAALALVDVLRGLGRTDEAREMAARLAASAPSE